MWLEKPSLSSKFGKRTKRVNLTFTHTLATTTMLLAYTRILNFARRLTKKKQRSKIKLWRFILTIGLFHSNSSCGFKIWPFFVTQFLGSELDSHFPFVLDPIYFISKTTNQENPARFMCNSNHLEKMSFREILENVSAPEWTVARIKYFNGSKKQVWRVCTSVRTAMMNFQQAWILIGKRTFCVHLSLVACVIRKTNSILKRLHRAENAYALSCPYIHMADSRCGQLLRWAQCADNK